MFENKTLMITGGTGSFGNAVLRRFLDTDIGEIRIFSRDEKKQDDMRNQYKDSKLKFFIGDTRNYESVAQAMAGVDYVFHAAALKQVPSCEFFPLEAVKKMCIRDRPSPWACMPFIENKTASSYIFRGRLCRRILRYGLKTSRCGSISAGTGWTA